MRVYIVRHGKATEPLFATGPGGEVLSDFERDLTARGQAQAAFLSERVKGVDIRPEAIFSSRFPRAMSTARPLAAALGCPLGSERGLEVDHDVSEALAIVEREQRAGRRAIMLVGHNPQLGELIGVLASGLPPQDMILKTGELVALDVRPNQMIGSAKIVGRLRLSTDKNDETIAGGVFAFGRTGAELAPL